MRRIVRRFGNRIRNIVRPRAVTRRRVDAEASLKSTLMEEAALTRGYSVTRLSSREILVEAVGRLIPFCEMNGPSSSVVGRILCDNKDYARQLLRRAGLPVVDSALVRSFDEAKAFADEFGYPVVVKPLDRARGIGVTTGIVTARGLKDALVHAQIQRKPVLVERQIDGDDFRFFVMCDRVVSVTSRVRASVVGDGISTVRQLIVRKNEERSRNRYLADYPIPLETSSLTALARRGLALSTVPAAGELVQLRDQSNLSAGGDSVDVTDTCHPTFKAIAIRAVAAVPGMEYAGVDILARTVFEPAGDAPYVVGEVEYSPAPLAMFPVVGQPRDMAGAVLEYYVGGA